MNLIDSAPIAHCHQERADMVIEYVNNHRARHALVDRIHESNNKLFRDTESIYEWEKTLLNL
jgi:hypothetical protein